MTVTKLRSILKTLSWRIIGTIDTMFLGWLITGSPLVGLKIGALELFTKMILYYFHERAWYSYNWKTRNRKRHFSKTISWRFIGTLDTLLLSWIFTGSPIMGLKIITGELFTKMLLYYLHERVWYASDWGVIKSES